MPDHGAWDRVAHPLAGRPRIKSEDEASGSRFPRMNANPRKSKVSGLPCPRFSKVRRFDAAELDEAGIVLMRRQ